MTYMKQINQTKNLTITIDMKQQKQNAGFYVNFICETSEPRAKPLDKIKSAALMDKTIQIPLSLLETDSGIKSTIFKLMKTMTW